MRSKDNIAIMSILIALVALIIMILSASYIISSAPAKDAKVDNLIDPLEGIGGDDSGYSTPNIVNIYRGDDDDDDDDDNDPEIDLWATSQDITQWYIEYYDLDSYASDDEDDHDELEFTVISPSNDNIIDVDIDYNTHVMSIWACGNVGDSVILTIEVEDTDGNTDRDSILINIVGSSSDPYAPVISPPIPDIAFGEDGMDNSIDLDDYVFDLDHLDSELTWTYSGNTNVQVLINSDHLVTFTATPDWSGAEYIIFRVEDPLGGYDEDIMLVTVTPVNDPAVWNPLSDQNYNEDHINEPDNVIYPNIIAQASDVDDPVVMTVVSTQPEFDLSIDIAGDLVISNLQQNWYGTRVVTLDANGVTSTFTLTINQMFDDEICIPTGPFTCEKDYI